MMQFELVKRENRVRVWGGALLLFLFVMLATPRIPHSPSLHLFADMRNFLGVPNTLNVLTSFPFLLIGVPGLVLCLSGSCFGISLKGEVWGWALYYAGAAAAAFGSAYYHLKPDDERVIWDRLPCFSQLVREIGTDAFGTSSKRTRQILESYPSCFHMMISASSVLSNLLIERYDERMGITCLFSLLMLVLVSIACERTFDDLRLCMMFYFVPCVAIPAMVFLFPPKYTHSRYWFWATGFYLLARFVAIADKRVYGVTRYVISGHSLEHLCLAMVPMMLTLMLWFRNIKIARAEGKV